MLSKSQARLFFLIMTAGFSLVFLTLTVDSLRQVPQRSHADAITPQVARGKAIWESNNCMGCHTLLGEGAYYAPELTKVVERRGKQWMALFLKDPAAMFPGKRQMVQYDFNDEQIADLVAFFEWIGSVDTNGFPAKPDLAPAAAMTVSAGGDSSIDRAPEMFRTVCKACHSVSGIGGAVGPALDGVALRKTPAELDAWLADPASVKPGTAMPNLNIPASTRSELVTWPSTLR